MLSLWKYIRYLGKDPGFTVEIYMKSGNVIVLPNVAEYHWEEKNGIRTVKLKQREQSKKRYLQMASFDVMQIEAIVTVNP